MWGRGPIGSNGACAALCQLSVTSPTTHNQSGPFWCWFLCGWACVCSRTLWVSPMNSPVRLGVSPTAASIPQVFSISGLRLYFPLLESWGFAVYFAPPLFLPVYLHANVGQQGPPATILPQVLSAQLCISTPTGLDECVFFNSLVVGLPYSLIFCQFWLFFVFKLLLSFFCSCEEAQCIYLHLHLVRKSSSSLSFIFGGSFGPYFFCLGAPVVRDRALGIFQCGAIHIAALWHCMSGRGPGGNNAACSTLGQLSVTSSSTHKQIGHFRCRFPGG